MCRNTFNHGFLLFTVMSFYAGVSDQAVLLSVEGVASGQSFFERCLIITVILPLSFIRPEAH